MSAAPLSLSLVSPLATSKGATKQNKPPFLYLTFRRTYLGWGSLGISDKGGLACRRRNVSKDLTLSTPGMKGK